MTNVSTTRTQASQSITGAGERARAALVAALTGAALLFFVGFAPSAAVHNAAHDTRHTLAFPCH